MYVAITNIPVGELLTGFAMRSDPNVVFVRVIRSLPPKRKRLEQENCDVSVSD